MKDMSAIGGGYEFMGSMPDNYNLVVNPNHRLIGQLAETGDESSRSTLAKQLIDLALLSQNLLKGSDLTSFIQRSVEIIK